MEKAIKVSNLTKKYGDNLVLDHIDISVEYGEIFGLLGANGAGKSTTIECILGTKKRDNGEIYLLGMDPIKHRKKLFENIGVQFQEICYPEKILVKELCEETVSLYRDPLSYKHLLKQFKLDHKINSSISQLSGGQKQKLFIILALIPNPKVVFLDELTTGLDPKSRREVWKALLELKKEGLTIFLTSHFMDEVEILCDKISILNRGKIIFNGKVNDAIKNSPYDKFEDAYLWYSGEEDEINESI